MRQAIELLDSPGSSASEFDDLYRTEYLPMLRLARLTTGSLAVAEEVVHDAFETMIGRLGQADGGTRVDNPGAYLRRVVVNKCYDVLRRAGTEQRRLESVSAGRDQVSLPPELDEMWRTLETLQPRQRVVLVLRFYEDLSIPQIAEALGEPEGTIKSLIHRGLKRLREEVQT